MALLRQGLRDQLDAAKTVLLPPTHRPRLDFSVDQLNNPRNPSHAMPAVNITTTAAKAFDVPEGKWGFVLRNNSTRRSTSA